MSHTYKAEQGTIFHYNPDFCGDVSVNVPLETNEFKGSVNVPAVDLLEFIGMRIRHQQIERYENSPPFDFVGGKP